MPWSRWAMLCYLALVGAVITAMFAARQRAMEQLATPQSVAQWQAWREDVQQQQTQSGPVQRRVPKSSEPPALVLMRDYFAVSLFGAILFTSALYWVIAWFVLGTLKTRN